MTTTISTPTSTNESFLIGMPYSTSQGSGHVIYREFNTAIQPPIPNTISIDDLVNEFEADPEMAGHLANARRSLSDNLYAENQNTLTSARLAAGMSQTQLAERVGTSQSHIAKIELGRTDPSTDLIARIAQALDTDEHIVFIAVRTQRALHEV